MCNSFTYMIRLVSDAEPSSGLGTELLNSLVPRTLDDYPFIPASHIKGLMRQGLLDIKNAFNPDGLQKCIDKAFGISDASGEKSNKLENEGMFYLEDAKSQKITSEVVSTVTRTALTDRGIAEEGSLRTTERIAVETEFEGEIHFFGKPSPLLEALIRYTMLSVMEIGGSRNRGCGACITSIKDEQATPGSLLKDILTLLAKGESPSVSHNSIGKPIGKSSDKHVALKLAFTASGPLCVPELPFVSETNTICSGFVIPASAVQGIVLHRINRISEEIATECFKSDLFRVWPMHPEIPDSQGLSVRAPSSLRMSKIADENGDYTFHDSAFTDDAPHNVPLNSPLKAVDGVLGTVDGTIQLWRDSDMPRSISAHAVINDPDKQQNLFTVESIAVKEFNGLVVMPEDAAEILKASLNDNPIVSVGKARSIRGTGQLRAVDLPNIPLSSQTPSCFIVQSPLMNEDNDLDRPAHEILNALIKSCGWGDVQNCSASISLQFGWNRHRNGRQSAVRVIEPGSVFKMSQPLDNVEDLLIRGLGSGRQRGCGAVWPHPGITKKRFNLGSDRVPVKSENEAGRIGWELFKDAKSSGLTASQIARVLSCLKQGPDKALDYMERQRRERPDKIWDRWKPVFAQVRHHIQKDPKQAENTIKVWHDLAVAESKKKGGNS